MSAGFSVGDFVALGQLAWTTYQACKNASGKYQKLSHELKSLHIALDRLKDEAEKPESLVRLDIERHSRKTRRIWRSCDEVLREVDGLIDKHRSLGMSKKKLRDRLQFGTMDLGDIRSEIAAHTNVINVYIGIVGLSSLGRLEQQSHINSDQLLKIQERIDGLATEFRAGKREGSILTTYSNDHKETWKTFRRSLLSSGFTSDSLTQYGPEIKAYLMQLTKNGMLDEEAYDPDGLQEEIGNEPTTNSFLKPSYIAETPSPPSPSARIDQISGIEIPGLTQSEQLVSTLSTDQHSLGESTTPEIPSFANDTRFTLPSRTDAQHPLGESITPEIPSSANDTRFTLPFRTDAQHPLGESTTPEIPSSANTTNSTLPYRPVGGFTRLMRPPRPMAKPATEPEAHPSEIISDETPGRFPRILTAGSLYEKLSVGRPMANRRYHTRRWADSR